MGAQKSKAPPTLRGRLVSDGNFVFMVVPKTPPTTPEQAAAQAAAAAAISAPSVNTTGPSPAAVAASSQPQAMGAYGLSGAALNASSNDEKGKRKDSKKNKDVHVVYAFDPEKKMEPCYTVELLRPPINAKGTAATTVLNFKSNAGDDLPKQKVRSRQPARRKAMPQVDLGNPDHLNIAGSITMVCALCFVLCLVGWLGLFVCLFCLFCVCLFCLFCVCLFVCLFVRLFVCLFVAFDGRVSERGKGVVR